MSSVEIADTPDPSQRDVAHYVRDMAAQLAAMALGAGLKERALALARELCDAALEDEA
ncbi:MAG TPA: hypothetical protein PKY87_14310 [Terricaulis sp.]|nr:hypothetical protein [Terricaulis sp.]